jgi:glycosyltransferase involved in cell wall biosynthesis
MPAKYREKSIYLPENAIWPERFERRAAQNGALPVRVAFVGRLVPYKGADMLIEAAAPLAREGKLEVDIMGDGPEMPRLRELRTRGGVEGTIHLDGWVPHEKLQDRLVQCDVFGFPSIREFGGGVVLEAMALGLAPVVVDYAGPRELVTADTGFTVPMGNRGEVIAGFREILGRLCGEPASLRLIGERARERAMRLFTWPQKAAQTVQVYEWVLGRRTTKPDFGTPLTQTAGETLA